MDERVNRISKMEERLNRLLAWNAGDRQAKKTVQEDARLLEEYYRSPQWREDFEADEAGKLPKELARGVLSEDGIYNALEEYSIRTDCCKNHRKYMKPQEQGKSTLQSVYVIKP